MDAKQIMKIFEDTAYVRMGGSVEELKAAEYLKNCCAALGLKAEIEGFQVEMAAMQEAALEADGMIVPCKGYFCAGSGEAEAPFYYLKGNDPYSLAGCKDKIVLVDGYMGYWLYQDILENGAIGFITYDGNINYSDWDIDQRELRGYVSKGRKIPGVNINAKSAVELVKSNAKTAKIVLEQEEYPGESHNVVLEMPGQTDEFIVFSAHYDSTSLSQGAYDNMSGSIGILALAEYFKDHPHRYGLRFIWCGSEERGLLGAKAYCQAHAEELKKAVLDINLDMVGCVMGRMSCICTTEEAAVQYVTYLGREKGVSIAVRQEVGSTDSTPFADIGVPAVFFGHYGPGNTGTIHNSYDTVALIKPENMTEDIAFIAAFSDRMANAVNCPIARVIPDNMKEKLDIYLARKREKK